MSRFRKYFSDESILRLAEKDSAIAKLIAQIRSSDTPQKERSQYTRLLSAKFGFAIAPPRVVHLDIVGTCNLNCIYCRDHSPFALSPRESWRNNPMDKALAIRLIHEAASLGAEIIPILGAGEPCLHPYLFDIIDVIYHSDLEYELYTNGLSFDGEIARYFSLRPNGKIAFSISAAKESTWARLRPEMDSKLISIMDNISKFRALRYQNGPRISIVHVICSENFQEVIPMTEQAIQIGADEIHFKIAELASFAPNLRLTKEQIDSLKKEIIHCRNLAGTFGIGFTDQILFELNRIDVETGLYSKGLYDRIPCFMGFELMRIRRDGQISFCCGLKFLANTGNVSLEDYWYGDTMNQARKAALSFPSNGNMQLPDRSMLRDESCDYCYNHAMNESFYNELCRRGLEITDQLELA